MVSLRGAPATQVLVPHADHRPRAVRSVRVDVTREREALTVRYALEGDLGAIQIPPPVEPGFVLGLWQHTCFELFVAADGAQPYHEANLSPSGAWAVFAFRGYHDGVPCLDPALAPTIAVRREPDRLLLDARVPLARWSPSYGSARLRMALTAVVEEAGGVCSYWALRHPSARPDFHHRDGFALLLET